MKFTVAIDGPAAAGKGTISRGLAEHFGLPHLDTGLLYRAVGRRVLNGEDAVGAARHLTADDLAAGDLRGADVAQAASRVAAIPEVRRALLDFQRDFARRDGGAVLDGRDIGTVICPDAEVKLFVTASDTVRTERRYRELKDRGVAVTRQQVARELGERDARDAARDAAPMQRAADAVLLDTSGMSVQDALAAAIAIVAPALEKARKGG